MHKQGEEKGMMTGTVYSFSKGFIKVLFAQEVQDADKLSWR